MIQKKTKNKITQKPELSISLYDNPWYFNGVPFTSDMISKYEGFVYLITDLLTGKKYIGRKYFWNIRKVKGKKTRQRTESDWKEYYSSSDEVNRLVLLFGSSNFRREILSLHITRGDCNYCELKEQFQRNVLESDEYYNSTIGKYNKVSARVIAGRLLHESSK